MEHDAHVWRAFSDVAGHHWPAWPGLAWPSLAWTWPMSWSARAERWAQGRIPRGGANRGWWCVPCGGRRAGYRPVAADRAGLFNAMLLAGVLYLAWLSRSLLRSKQAGASAVHTRRTPGQASASGKDRDARARKGNTGSASSPCATFRGAG